MDIPQLASQIRKNRLSGIDSDPSQIPLSGINAYAVQNEITKSFGIIKAWKAGGTNEKTQTYFNTSDAYFGPIPANVYLADKALNISSKTLLFPLKGEVEICFCLNKKINELADNFTLADVIPTINSVHLGLEMPWTQFSQPESGLDYLIADLCGANALLVGKGIQYSIWQQFSDDTLNLVCDDLRLTSGNVRDAIIQPLETLFRFAQFCQTYEIEILDGALLATGGVTQCVALETGKQISITSKHLPMLNILIG